MKLGGLAEVIRGCDRRKLAILLFVSKLTRAGEGLCGSRDVRLSSVKRCSVVPTNSNQVLRSITSIFLLREAAMSVKFFCSCPTEESKIQIIVLVWHEKPSDHVNRRSPAVAGIFL